MALTKFATRNLILLSVLILSGAGSIGARFTSGYSQCGKGKSTLKAVSMLFRHGDRTPTLAYPLDPYRDYPWPGGFEALSEKGAQQLHTSGIIKSARYSSLFSTNCDLAATHTVDLDKILVFSSSAQRCVDTVTNFLNGFIKVEWPSSLINVIPLDQDEMLAVPGKPCPKHESIIRTGPSLDDPDFKKIIDFESPEGKELLAYLEKNTGMPVFSSTVLHYLEDTLSIQKSNNLELPAWSEAVYEPYLKPFALVVFKAWASSYYMEFRSSILLRNITNIFDNVIAGSADPNILLYSAHDATIGGMLYFFGVWDQVPGVPAYASSLNLELHENAEIDDDYEVKLVYFPSYNGENPIEIKIPNCQAPCPYKQFKWNFQPRLTPNYDSVCST
ncbi:unnamed protein product [Hermetia illucens]|uniref:Acid phosphatase n=1 Tax=Hermetia illucens TaxID=343691 RepID=A0A7R8UQ00_HERIL|nr:testicular acid phosphatase homolog isoform X2 [Hermetia illucens]CAD7084869.1 unnamed protein product [Hermetia illucens]